MWVVLFSKKRSKALSDGLIYEESNAGEILDSLSDLDDKEILFILAQNNNLHESNSEKSFYEHFLFVAEDIVVECELELEKVNNISEHNFKYISVYK